MNCPGRIDHILVDTCQFQPGQVLDKGVEEAAKKVSNDAVARRTHPLPPPDPPEGNTGAATQPMVVDLTSIEPRT